MFPLGEKKMYCRTTGITEQTDMKMKLCKAYVVIAVDRMCCGRMTQCSDILFWSFPQRTK